MNRVSQTPLHSERPNVEAQVFNYCRHAITVMALLCYVLTLWTVLSPTALAGKQGWPETMLLLALTGVTVMSLTRQLPGQNVLLAVVVIGVAGGGLHGLSAATALPFGPVTYTLRIGTRLMDVFVWPVPFLWIVAVLNSRGVARLILRPWRKLRNYGLWLIGFTVVFTVLFDLALEPFMTHAREFWVWQLTKFPWTWHTMPLINPLGWLVTTLLILAFVTPALIGKKQRSSQSPPDYHPLAVWLLCMVLFGVGAATQQLWSAVAYCTVIGIVVAVFAVRGARW